jgi:hypothetical protein
MSRRPRVTLSRVGLLSNKRFDPTLQAHYADAGSK